MESHLKIRGFLAFELPQDFRGLLLRRFSEMAEFFPGSCRPEKEDKLHITVKFLGDIENQILPELTTSLKSEIPAPEFELQTRKFGYFGSKKEPTVLWAGAEFQPLVGDYIGRVNSVLKKFKFSVIDKDFHPHITLMRVRKTLPEGFMDKFLSLDVTNLNCRIRSFVLYESKLLKTGSVYRPLLKIIEKFQTN